MIVASTVSRQFIFGLKSASRSSSSRNGGFLVSQKLSSRVKRSLSHQATLGSTPGSDSIRIVEVGPRDGLQNIKQSVSSRTKIQLIQKLAATGLRDIEATSFVSPKWVPQMADGLEIMHSITTSSQIDKLRYQVLVPNMKGLESAVRAKAKEIVVFASATEAFSKKNQNCTVEEALNRANEVTQAAKEHGMLVRGVVSCVFADPYSGKTEPQEVVPVVQRLFDMGCYEVCIADTLGVGTPKDTENLLNVLLPIFPREKLACHFHDTYGQALANVVKAYDMGIRTFDSSVAGLGGCPFARGAKGNVSTEDIVYMFEKSGIHTGVDVDKIVSVGQWISDELGIPNGSRAGAALAAKQQPQAGALEASSSRSSLEWTTVQNADDYTVTQSGASIRITLTRPRNGNALTMAMVDGLTKLFTDLARDPSVFHIIIDAEGRFFCTGMDLSGGTRTSDMSSESNYYGKVKALYEAIDNAPQTTIAVVHGPCYGGGVGLTFACDVRLVSSSASWTLSEVKLGLVPAIISKYMVREWGVSFAREAMLTGREVKPEELLRFGVVQRISKDSKELVTALGDYMQMLKRCAPKSAAHCKELVKLGWLDAGGQQEDAKIEDIFGKMMAPGSEGEFGMAQFRKKVKGIDWSAFWSSKRMS